VRCTAAAPDAVAFFRIDSRFEFEVRGKMFAVVVKETKSGRTRRRILDAAAELFSEQGYSARLSDIADRAEMKAGSLYYHFDSREELVAEVLRLGIDGSWDQVAGALARLPKSASPIERLTAAIRAHTLSIVGRSAYATAQARIVGSLPPEVARAHRKERRAYGEYWRDLFTSAQQAGQIDSDVDVFVECQMPATIPMFRLVHFQLERQGRDFADVPAVFQGKVLSAVYRVGPYKSSTGTPQGYALRLLVEPRGATMAAPRRLAVAN